MNSIFVAKIRILVAKVGILLLANAILSPIADPWIAEREPRMDELFGRTVKLDEQFMAKLSSEIGPDDALLGKVRARYTTAQALEFIGIPFARPVYPALNTQLQLDSHRVISRVISTDFRLSG